MAVDATMQVNDDRTGHKLLIGLTIIGTIDDEPVYGVSTVAEPAGSNSPMRTPHLTRVTASGTVAAGASSVAVANMGDANGELLGEMLQVGESVRYVAPAGTMLAALAYDATGTEFLISEVR